MMSDEPTVEFGDIASTVTRSPCVAVNVIETAPRPLASGIWAPHNVPGEAGTTLRAPLTQETIDMAPLVMIEPIATWGLQQWYPALVFGAQ